MEVALGKMHVIDRLEFARQHLKAPDTIRLITQQVCRDVPRRFKAVTDAKALLSAY